MLILVGKQVALTDAVANIKAEKTVTTEMSSRAFALVGLEKEGQAAEIEANMFTFGIPPAHWLALRRPMYCLR